MQGHANRASRGGREVWVSDSSGPTSTAGYQLLVNDEAQKGANQVTVSGRLYVNISGDYPVVVRFTPAS
jgi:hypothetical protein